MKKVISLLRKAYLANCLAKEDFLNKRYYYNKKNDILIKVIILIKKNKLSIKYGVKEGVLYFSHNLEQVSFHVFSKKLLNIKKYNGNWKGSVNKYFSL